MVINSMNDYYDFCQTIFIVFLFIRAFTDSSTTRVVTITLKIFYGPMGAGP
jgi:hypothetical protein